MLRAVGSAENILTPEAAAAHQARSAAARLAAPLQCLRRWWPDFGLAAEPVVERFASAFASEERLIARAVDRRRNEFRAGRAAARAALAQIGCAPAAILAHPQRDPIWPAGFLGSITHSDSHALALAAPSRLIDAVGVDLEDDSALDASLTASVCRPDERPAHAQFAGLGIDHAKLCFVAKEAVFKAIFPRQRSALQFQQLRLRFHIRDRSFRVEIRGAATQVLSQLPGSGRFVCDPGVLMAAFVIRRRA